MKRETLTASLPTRKLTVLLVDDHPYCRKALKLLLDSTDDINVVGEAKNGHEAVRLTKILLPEVVVMDISLPLLNGIEATRQIMKILPKTRVLILSANTDSEYLRQAVISGASGYLIKQCSMHVIAEAIREVDMGKSFFCASIAKPLRNHCRKLFEKSSR